MKVIFWVTALVFIGLVVFGWGADITGTRGRGRNLDANIAGKIDDYEITYPVYQQAIQNEYERAYNQNRAIGNAEAEIIRDRTWYTLINQYLAGKQFAAKGVDVLTDKEVFEAVRRDPPDAVKQNENFQRDGQFDRALFEEYLSNPQVDWLPVEMFVRNNLPYDKLQMLINALPVVTNLDAKREFKFRNETARASYIKIDPFAIDDISVDTSDAAVQAYYDEHKNDYYTDEAVVVNYATLPIEPTRQDTLETKALAEELITRIEAGEEFEFLAENYSDDPGSKFRGGELGWFGRSQMVPEFEEAVFAADSGEIVGPVLTDFGYHIIKVLAKTDLGDSLGNGDSVIVYAAHILLSIKPGIDTEDSIRVLTTDLVNDIEEGADFFEVAEALDIDSIGQSAPLGEKDPIPGVGFLESVRAMLFKGDIGAVETVPIILREKPLLEGITVIQLVRRIEEGIPSLMTIRDRVVMDMLREAREKAALELAREAHKLVKSGVDFESAAEQVGAQFDTTGTFGRYGWIEGIGDDPIFKGTVFGLRDVGKVSEVFQGLDGTAFIVRLDEITPPSPAAYTSQELQIKTDLINFMKQGVYERWFANLREQADIVDNRFVELYGEGTGEDKE